VNHFKALNRRNILGQIVLTCFLAGGLFPKVIAQGYFQQEVNYTIHVTLNDKHHELNAFESVEYINHSPDTLGFVYFHLWPNGYSCNNTGLARQLFELKGKEKLFNDPELKGYIDSLDFMVNDVPVKWDLLPGQPDICRIIFNQPLKPGDTINLTTPFHIKIPKGVTSRLGHIGESYQISQWYPKPAVYDRSGWHQMPYLDQGEFYSEFGSFDVSITLPANYIVGATGNLQNELESEKLDSLAADTTWKSTVNSARNIFPPSSEKMKTLRYTESRIHDFAWFADKRFHVVKGKVALPDSGRKITTWVMFTNRQAKLWKDAIPYVNNAIYYFSKWDGDYPYNSFTAVQSALNAGVGMEYPGITVIGLIGDAYALDRVIAHEIGHNWFYSVLGSDERRYPFMDEGITSAYEERYMAERYPGKKMWEVYSKNKKLARFLHIEDLPEKLTQELEWLVPARLNLEQPIDLPAPDFSISNYDLMLYKKAATGFNYLRVYLGDSLFDVTMHDYYRQWKYKHPQPDDLRAIFESHVSKDLSWFFNDFIKTTKRLDYAVIRVEDQKLLVKNKGELVSPTVISGMIGDSICFEKWVDGFSGRKWIEFPEGNYTEIKIDPTHMTPELFRLNNNIRTSGVFPKADPIGAQLMIFGDDPDKRIVTYMPLVNWTKENGFMAGVALNNSSFTPKPFEYFFTPFYTFHSPGLAGFGRISYNITPYDMFIRMMTFNLEGTQFGAPGNQNYHKIKAGFELDFRTNGVNNSLLQKAFGSYISATDLSQIEMPEKAKTTSFIQLGYQWERVGMINPFKVLTSIEYNKSFQKISATFNYRYSYWGRDDGLDIRIFAGEMLKSNFMVPFYSLSASGRSGRELYLYEGIYPNRFGVFPDTFWSRQMTFSEGGLVSPVNDRLGYSQRLVSLSLTSSLPEKAHWVAVKPFANFLWNDHGVDTSHPSPFFCELGIKTGIWNLFEIYVPLLVSKNIQSITGSFKNRIRIVFNLDSFNRIKIDQARMLN